MGYRRERGESVHGGSGRDILSRTVPEAQSGSLQRGYACAWFAGA
jgi:hypothetical protein